MYELLVALLVFTAQLPPPPAAQAGFNCPDGIPRYRDGFATLYGTLGIETMGAAWTCEYPDPRGTGDVLQRTYRGLAYWRKATNTATFADGSYHWAITPRGVVWWDTPDVDPPPSAVPGLGFFDSLRQACDRGELPDLPLCDVR